MALWRDLISCGMVVERDQAPRDRADSLSLLNAQEGLAVPSVGCPA
jgi:hypothetical protein